MPLKYSTDIIFDVIDVRTSDFISQSDEGLFLKRKRRITYLE